MTNTMKGGFLRDDSGALVLSGGGGGDFVVPGGVGNGVADATSAIQAKLDAANTAGGGHVYIPRGTYVITSDLLIYSNTKLELSAGATIQRGSTSVDGMIHNGAAPTPVGSYVNPNAQNIQIYGGTWDGNQANFPANHNGISFGGGTNITIRDTTIKNIYGWHHIEIKGCKQVMVQNVICRDLDSTTSGKECMQFDVVNTTGGWYNMNADGGPNIDVKIIGCTFLNACRGVGSHNVLSGGIRHSQVKIEGCHFENLREESVRARDWQHLVVTGCTFKSVFGGVQVMSTTQSCQSFSITNNTFETLGANVPALATSVFAVLFDGESFANFRIGDFAITGNVIRGSLGSGILLKYVFAGTVTGNEVRECSLYGIKLQSSKTTSVVGNTARVNGTSASPAGDVYVGNETGSSNTETQDITVTGNTIAAMIVATGTRYILSNNNFLTSYTVTTTAGTLVQKFNNFVGGSWVA